MWELCKEKIQEAEKQFMGLAYAEAVAAGLRHEVPVGAVLVDTDGVVLAQNGNRTIELSDPCAHAEILTLRSGGMKLSGNGAPPLAGSLMVTRLPLARCVSAKSPFRSASVGTVTLT